MITGTGTIILMKDGKGLKNIQAVNISIEPSDILTASIVAPVISVEIKDGIKIIKVDI